MQNLIQPPATTDEITLMVIITLLVVSILGVGCVVGWLWFKSVDCDVPAKGGTDTELEDCECSSARL
jgi:hypothetical protein